VGGSWAVSRKTGLPDTASARRPCTPQYPAPELSLALSGVPEHPPDSNSNSIGATSSSWLARAISGRFATDLQRPYRAHAGYRTRPCQVYAAPYRRAGQHTSEWAVRAAANPPPASTTARFRRGVQAGIA
jgi:hypothetical protein